MVGMATPAGLEPALSGVTGRHFNQLNYGAIYSVNLLCVFIYRFPLSHILLTRIPQRAPKLSTGGSLIYKIHDNGFTDFLF